MDPSIIDRYEQGASALPASIVDLTKDDLLATPIPGTWSIQQIVVHLMDSDLIGSDRMKRIAAMDKPLLIGYDESAFARLPGTDDLDVAIACDIFVKNRRMTAAILRRLDEAAFKRSGIHNEKGLVTLEDQVHAYIEHLEYHLSFIKKKRGLLGKPL